MFWMFPKATNQINFFYWCWAHFISNVRLWNPLRLERIFISNENCWKEPLLIIPILIVNDFQCWWNIVAARRLNKSIQTIMKHWALGSWTGADSKWPHLIEADKKGQINRDTLKIDWNHWNSFLKKSSLFSSLFYILH